MQPNTECWVEYAHTDICLGRTELEIVPIKRKRNADDAALCVCAAQTVYAGLGKRRYRFAEYPIVDKSEILFTKTCASGLYEMDAPYNIFIERADI